MRREAQPCRALLSLAASLAVRDVVVKARMYDRGDDPKMAIAMAREAAEEAIP
jgi:hypothetical protein